MSVRVPMLEIMDQYYKSQDTEAVKGNTDLEDLENSYGTVGSVYAKTNTFANDKIRDHELKTDTLYQTLTLEEQRLMTPAQFKSLVYDNSANSLFRQIDIPTFKNSKARDSAAKFKVLKDYLDNEELPGKLKFEEKLNEANVQQIKVKHPDLELKDIEELEKLRYLDYFEKMDIYKLAQELVDQADLDSVSFFANPDFDMFKGHLENIRDGAKFEKEFYEDDLSYYANDPAKIEKARERYHRESEKLYQRIDELIELVQSNSNKNLRDYYNTKVKNMKQAHTNEFLEDINSLNNIIYRIIQANTGENGEIISQQLDQRIKQLLEHYRKGEIQLPAVFQNLSLLADIGEPFKLEYKVMGDPVGSLNEYHNIAKSNNLFFVPGIENLKNTTTIQTFKDEQGNSRKVLNVSPSVAVHYEDKLKNTASIKELNKLNVLSQQFIAKDKKKDYVSTYNKTIKDLQNIGFEIDKDLIKPMKPSASPDQILNNVVNLQSVVGKIMQALEISKKPTVRNPIDLAQLVMTKISTFRYEPLGDIRYLKLNEPQVEVMKETPTWSHTAKQLERKGRKVQFDDYTFEYNVLSDEDLREMIKDVRTTPGDLYIVDMQSGRLFPIDVKHAFIGGTYIFKRKSKIGPQQSDVPKSEGTGKGTGKGESGGSLAYYPAIKSILRDEKQLIPYDHLKYDKIISRIHHMPDLLRPKKSKDHYAKRMAGGFLFNIAKKALKTFNPADIIKHAGNAIKNNIVHKTQKAVETFKNESENNWNKFKQSEKRNAANILNNAKNLARRPSLSSGSQLLSSVGKIALQPVVSSVRQLATTNDLLSGIPGVNIANTALQFAIPEIGIAMSAANAVKNVDDGKYFKAAINGLESLLGADVIPEGFSEPLTAAVMVANNADKIKNTVKEKIDNFSQGKF